MDNFHYVGNSKKVQYVGQVVRNGAKILVTRWYHERANKNFGRYFTVQRAVHAIKGYFSRIIFLYNKKQNKTGESIPNVDVNTEDIYLPDFLSR